LNLNLHTWRNLLVSLYLVLGRVFGKRLGRSTRTSKGLKRKGLRLGRFLPRPKPKVLHQPKALVGVVPTVVLGCLLRLKISTAAESGVGQGVSSSGGGSCFSAVAPVMPLSLIVFPSLPALDLLPPATFDIAPAPVRSKVGSSFVHASLPNFSVEAGVGLAPIPSPSRAAMLEEKIHCSLPILHPSKPFQRYYKKARELRVGHSVK